MINVFLIWDFDAAIGQINATFPYKFRMETISNELSNVEYILQTSQKFNHYYTFAITGFSAEKSSFPFGIRDFIKEIYNQGHEIASHSWKHEWFPLLMEQQIIKSLERSKFILEDCIGERGSVKGFVPPHNRPMTWIRKGSISLGDRGIFPFFKGGDIGMITKVLANLDYGWTRMVYKTPFERLCRLNAYASLKRDIICHNNIKIVPLNYNGFDQGAIDILELGYENNKDVFICGHPSGLSRNREESRINYDRFIEYLSCNVEKYNVTTVTGK